MEYSDKARAELLTIYIQTIFRLLDDCRIIDTNPALNKFVKHAKKDLTNINSAHTIRST